ncbi:MAG: lipopolysaccharide heptosyltransferase family protein [Cytophagales bacterium]|nr:MAG: lipopolysaccharide heptosyltransferase family protein [Cytophagales bacterium]
MESKKKKILVIRLSAIGDIVWTSPSLRCLKTQLPNVELHFCTKKQYQSMVENNPYLDKIHYLEDDLNTLVKTLKAEQFDTVIDLHKNLRSAWIRWHLWKKSYSYSKKSFRRWLFVNFKLPVMTTLHVAERYLEAIKPLGIVDDGKGLDYFLSEKDSVSKEKLPITHQNGYTAFIIGASTFTKRLPMNKMIELCQKINMPIMLLGGKEELSTGNELVKAFEQPEMKAKCQTVIYNACGIFSLNESVFLAKQAQFVFGHDTGLTHILAAYKKKIYAIYGGTSTIGFYPYRTDYYAIENKNLRCRPCSKSGLDSCPKKHFKCMQDINFDFELSQATQVSDDYSNKRS